MRYVSTRGEAPELGFSDALLTGLARDGGLYVPKEWPHFSKKEIRSLRGKSYQEIALAVLTPFAGKDIATEDLKQMIDAAYATFKHAAVAETDRSVDTFEAFQRETEQVLSADFPPAATAAQRSVG